jgi:hypothetical protein
MPDGICGRAKRNGRTSVLGLWSLVIARPLHGFYHAWFLFRVGRVEGCLAKNDIPTLSIHGKV